VGGVNAQERIIAAVAKAAHAEVVGTGMAGYFDESFAEFARAAGGDEREGRRARQRMLDAGLLYEHQPGFYRASSGVLLLYESTDRQEGTARTQYGAICCTSCAGATRRATGSSSGTRPATSTRRRKCTPRPRYSSI
jgi:hypothetical protein